MTTPFPPDPDAPRPQPDPDAPPPAPDPDAPFPPDPEAPPPAPDPDVPPPVPDPDVPPPAPERTRFAQPAAPPVPAPPSTPTAAPPVPTEQPEPAPREVADPTATAPLERPQRPRGVLAALTAVVVLLAVLTGFLGWRAVDTAGKGPVEKSRTEALAAARAAAVRVFSYDYRQLDKDFKAGLAMTTGEFRTDYVRTTGKLMSDVAPRYHAVVSAAVSEAAVVDASESRVLTLVFVNQQSTSTLIKAPKITTSRLEMTMVRRDNRWLVSKIDAL